MKKLFAFNRRRILALSLMVSLIPITNHVHADQTPLDSAMTSTDGYVESAQSRLLVDHVSWTMSRSVAPLSVLNRELPMNEAGLVFIRPYDNDGLDTSLNVSVNGRLHTSLQPGNFTFADSCAGSNVIGLAPTQLETNDPFTNAESFDLKGGELHYFYVEVDDMGVASIKKITQNSAEQILSNKRYQNHLISRLEQTCPPIKPPVKKPVQPVLAPLPIQPKRPIEVSAPIIYNEPFEMDVLFDFDSAKVKPTYSYRVDDLALFLNENAEATATIDGHTDSVGTQEYNLDLSKRRAQAVADLVINKHGIDPARITTQGFGESQPTATNKTAEGRQQNRRVVGTTSRGAVIE